MVGDCLHLVFWLDRIRTLVSMATDSSHRVIMEKPCDHSSSFIFYCFFLYLQVARTTIKSGMGSKLGSIRRRTSDLAALEMWKNPHRLIMGETL